MEPKCVVVVAKNKPATFPRLLICEGTEDKYFFERLIEERGLPHFHIREAHGNSKFAAAIDDFRLYRTAAFNSLAAIVVVADNDEDPQNRFESVCRQIENVLGVGTAPTAPQQATSGHPSVVVLMLPWTGVNGHLERLCSDAARFADQQRGADVDTFLGLVAADNWNNESRFAKAWLRANLAVRCANDPFLPLGLAFREARHMHLVPVTHNSFDNVANFLAQF